MKQDYKYEELWNTYQKEIRTNSLTELPKDYYKNNECQNNIEQDKKNANASANFETILKKIKEKRMQKIILYIAYQKPMPVQIPEEEEEIYKKITEVIKNTNKQETGKETTKEYNLNAIREIPEIYLPSGEKIGPLNKNQKINIKNKTDADFLLSNKICDVYI